MERKIGISFENLTFSTKDGKEILKSINGNFEGGKLVGILGPSGAGKTTLLKLLSGFIPKGYQGTIKVNEISRNLKKLKEISRYITQEDDLHGLLTVEENMKFAADLQLGNEFDKDTKNMNINNILTKFALDKIKTNLTSKLSGGEKKRLAICLELISDPSVIFVDEPTSGLDHVSSHSCIQFLKELSTLHKTIICTIHQPSTSLFNCFDHVYFLAEGKCIYEGSPLNITDYLGSHGYHCNIHHSPADFAIEIASGEYGLNEIDNLVNILKDNQQKIKFKSNNHSRITLFDGLEDNLPKKKTRVHLLKHKLYEMKTLASREFAKLKRNFIMLNLRISAQFLCALFISSLFWDIGMDASKLSLNLNLLIIIVGCLAWIQMYSTILSFPTEVPILRKEHFNGYFSFSNYFFVTIMWDVIFSIIVTALMSLIYFLTGQPNELFRVVMFLAIGFFSAMNGQSIGLLAGGISKIENGLLACTYINLILLVISGFCIVFKDIPSYYTWITYISYLRYGVTGIASAIYGYGREKLVCVEETGCLYTDVKKVLKDFGIEGNTFWRDSIALTINYIIIKITAYFFIKRQLRTGI